VAVSSSLTQRPAGETRSVGTDLAVGQLPPGLLPVGKPSKPGVPGRCERPGGLQVTHGEWMALGSGLFSHKAKNGVVLVWSNRLAHKQRVIDPQAVA
jgi:hypothetical protein